MSNLALPDWLQAQTLAPPMIQRATLASTGRYSGATDVADLMSGDTWTMSVGIPASKLRNSARVEAFINQLVGGVNLLQCHHLARPLPQGTLRGNPTVSSTVALGASALPVAGAASAINLVLGPDFDFDSNADGLCDNWTAYNTGNTGVITRTRDNTTAVGSGFSQTIACASMGGATTDRAGIVQILAQSGSVGATITASAHAWGDVGQKVRVFVQLWSGGVAGQVVADSTATLTGSWTRYSATGVAAQAFDQIYVYVWHQERPGGGFGPATLHVDKVQLQYGPLTDYAGPIELWPGDMLGTGNNLWQVASYVQFNDAGAASVPLVNRVRATIASGTPVVWNKPAALWRLQGRPQPMLQPGSASALQLDLVEKAF